MKFRVFVLFFVLISISQWAKGQIVVSGNVVDSITGSPRAFVNILVNEDVFGGTTDIDGNFSIKSPIPVRFLKLSYVGYYPKTVELIGNSKKLMITLSRKDIELSGVVIYPGENPAHAIIKKTIANRKLNDPENIPSFKYKTYNKITAEWYLDKSKYCISKDPDTKLKDDSTYIRLSKQAEEQYIMVMESYTERIFLNGKSQEKVLGTKVSGFSDPNFTSLANDIQPFSFYTDFISLSITDVKDYLNPISNGSIGRYSYLLEDTLYSGNDSVFVISFKPMKGKNFNALKGVLYINSNRYAIQNVIAQPAEEGLWTIKIQQMYSFVDNKYWFPLQLNYDWVLPNYPSEKVGVTMRGRSYISEIDFNAENKNKDFGPSNIVFENGAGIHDENYWKEHRRDTLNAKEVKTYVKMDSLGKKMKFDYISRALGKIIEGYLPLSILDISLEQLFRYNNNEGVRIGLGIRTNEKLCRWFTVGGFVGYGFWDKRIKYGGDLEFTISKKHEIFIGANYLKDLESPGQTSLYEYNNLSYWNEFLIDRIDFVERYNAYFKFRTLRYAQIEISGLQESRTPEYDYYYLPPATDTFAIYKFTELKLGIRYAYKEKLIDAFNKRYGLGTKYPVFYFTYVHGFKDLLGGQFNYDKIEFAVEKNFMIKHFGRTNLLLETGYIWNKVPYMKLFNGKGSYSSSFMLYFRNTFQTMRIDEFLYDKYVSLQIKHSFGSYLFKINNFKPELSISQGILYGVLSDSSYHKVIQFKVPDKCYFESGLIFDNLVRLKIFNLVYLKLGAGVFYRYGYYAFKNELKNFSFKLSLKLSGSK